MCLHVAQRAPMARKFDTFVVKPIVNAMYIVCTWWKSCHNAATCQDRARKLAVSERSTAEESKASNQESSWASRRAGGRAGGSLGSTGRRAAWWIKTRMYSMTKKM